MKLFTNLNKINFIQVTTNRAFIANNAILRFSENEAFRNYLNNRDGLRIDELVFQLNEQIAPQIDCTQCGACCNQLMVNITEAEAAATASFLNQSLESFKQQYVEQGWSDKMIMNAIPCHFLKDCSCTIYEKRFTECRAFPNLDQPNFKSRLFATLIHYGMCPIIYNVIEELKIATGFLKKQADL